METKKIFALAFFAFKPDPAQQITRSDAVSISTTSPGNVHECNMTFDFCADYAYSASKETAEADALKWAREENWPVSEGWALHRVHAFEIPLDEITESIRALLSSLPPDKESSNEASEGQGEEWADLIDG
jgi:hypothetical protein